MITGVRIMGVFYQNEYRQDKNVVWPEVPGAQRMSHSDIQAYLLRVLYNIHTRSGHAFLAARAALNQHM